MIAHASDAFAPGDSFGIATTSAADLPQPAAGPGALLVPVLVLIAFLILVNRFGG